LGVGVRVGVRLIGLASTSASQLEMPRRLVRARMMMGMWKRRNSKGFICSISW
jgi:hypothetical protein